MDNNREINQRVKEIRKFLRLTQKEFSSRMEMKQGSLSDIERGRIGVSNRLINMLCSEFNISAQWIHMGNGEMIIEDNLFSRRKELGMTQKEMAERLKVSQPFYSAVENGRKKISKQMKIGIDDMPKEHYRLKIIRKDVSKSQKEMADILDVQASYYSDVENGKRSLTKKFAQKLTAAFCISMDWLYTGAGNMRNGSIDKEMLIAIKHFIESVWMMRKAQLDALKTPLDESVVLRNTLYELEVDRQLAMLVK